MSTKKKTLFYYNEAAGLSACPLKDVLVLQENRCRLINIGRAGNLISTVTL